MSGAEQAKVHLEVDKPSVDEQEPEQNKGQETTTDEESVKLALASLFSDPGLQGEADEENETQLNVEDIPERVRPILLDKWRRLRSKLDFSRPSVQGEHLKGNAEYCQNIEEKLASVEAALQAKTMETEEDAKRIEEFHTEGVQNRQKLIEFDQENERYKSENIQLKQERDRYVTEIADISDVGKRRDQEFLRLEEGMKKIGEELGKANAAKCDALIRAEDVAAKEVSLAYREKRLEDDRELMQQHINSLTEDLHSTTEKANASKRELITRVSQLQATLEEKQGHIRLLEGRAEALNGDKEVIQARLDSLCERLKDARDSNTHLEEGYNEEIRAQTNLANLYKTKAVDAEEKSSELAKAVEELQGLLKQSSERYGALEDNLEKEKTDNKQEIQRRNDAIRALKKELQDANDLVKSLKHRGLTEEGINLLSPAAAAASKLIKSGMSLTQVYTQLVSCQEELLNAKDENRQLNTYVEQILSDIEERAPAFKRQRDEYERSLHSINGLKIDLQNEKESHESDRTEVETVKRKFASVVRENERSQKQVKDLSTQVVTLVREVEAARFGRTTKDGNILTSPGGSQASTTVADGVISERLVNFHDVSELQQKNVELLTVIREMASNQEKAETQLVEEKTADLKRELENVTSRVEELREARRRQETLMDNLVVQRDMYKSMAESNAEQLRTSPKATSTPGVSMLRSTKEQNLELSTPVKGQDKNAYRELEVRAVKSEAALAEIKKDFDVYREEKCENEKMITEMLDKTREELNETRGKAIKLASHEEWNTERFKLAQNNAANYKTEIGLLEERNKTLHSVIAKHENGIDALHKELLNSQTIFSKTERSYERAQNEIKMLKIAESRLQQECEILHRQKTGSALISENLKMVQVQIEKGESESKMRLQNEKDSLQKEVHLLRKKLDNEVESYKASVQAWEASERELRNEIQNMKTKECESTKAFDENLTALESTRTQLKLAEEKLAEVQMTSGGTEVEATSRTSESKIADLQNQIIVLKNGTVNLKEHVSKARNATEQYKKLADAAEKQVFDSNSASKQLQSSLLQQIQQLKNEIDRLQANILQHEKEKEEIRKSATNSFKDLANTNANEQIQQLKRDLGSSNGMLNETTQEIQSLRQLMDVKEVEFHKQVKLAADVQDRYERELTNHGQTTQTVIQLREQISRHTQIANDLAEAKQKAESDLMGIKQETNVAQSTLKEEYKLLSEQFEVVEANNKALYTQLTNISQQMTSLRASNTIVGDDASQFNKSIDTNIPGSDHSEENASTIEQFMDIIKYLRKEKEILTGKNEVVVAESTRLKAQFDATNNQLNESQSALQLAAENGSSTMMPSTRFEDLMEKIQTIPALKDSNRVLREENNKFSERVDELQNELLQATNEIEPLTAHITAQEELHERQKAELSALMTDNQKWRNRVSGLIEKHQKINPEEMKKIQIQNSQLAKQSVTLQNQLKQQAGKNSEEIANIKRELEANKSALMSKLQDVEKVKEESRLRSMEEIASVKRGLESNKVALKTKNQELETVKKESLIKTGTVNKLKALGRNLQEKNKTYEKEIGSLRKQLEEKQTEIKAANDAAKVVATTSEEGNNPEIPKKLAEAESLIEESARTISELEEDKKDISKEKDELLGRVKEKDEEYQKILEKCNKAEQKEQRARDVLINAKNRITKLNEENLALKGNLEANPDAQRIENAQLQQRIGKLTQDLQSVKDSSESEKQQLITEYQKQLQQMRDSKMEQYREQPGLPGEGKSQSNVTASVKPVMASSVIAGTSSNQQTGQRKHSAVQPQAHVTPLTRQTHISAQTATIRPTAMRTSNVIRSQQGASSSPASTATPDITAGPSNVPQVSVQPTIVSVVGPTSSNVQSTSAPSGSHRLNPLASEFMSRSSTMSTGTSSPATSSTTAVSQLDHANIDSSEEHLTQPSIQGQSSQSHRSGQKATPMVPLRQSSEESSVAGPSPSTSGAAMLSVAPKRRRDDSDIHHAENQKKLRQETAASTLDAGESSSGTGTSLNVPSPSNLPRRPGTTEVATSSTVQGEDDIVVIDSNSSTGDEEDIDEEEEQNDCKDAIEDEEENDDDEDDTNVDDEEEEAEEEEGEYIDEGRENMELEDNDQDESDVQEEEEQEGEGIDEEEEDDGMGDNNEENEADSVGQDPQVDVSDGEIVDEEGGEDNEEVAQAVEAAMVAVRRQVQAKTSREDDIVVLESSDDDEDDEEGIDDGNDEDGDAGGEHTHSTNVARVEDEEETEEVMEDVVEDQESSQLQFPEQSDDRRSTATASRGVMSDAGGNSIVPELGEMIASSSERMPGDSLQVTGIPQYQRHAPESSSSVAAVGSQHGQEAQGSNQFEDGKDDSVVPSTPKFGDGVMHSSRGVPGSSSSIMNIVSDDRSGSGAITARPFGDLPPNAFVFASHSTARGESLGTSNVTSSSNRSTFDISSGVSGTVSDLSMQHGLDRTSIDIAQLTGNQALVASNEPTSGDGSNILTSSVMPSHRSPSIPAPSTSRADQISMSQPATVSGHVVSTESQPTADVGSSEGDFQLNPDPTENITSQQHGQSSEIVTSSSGSASASSQQLPSETSSSSGHVAQPPVPRGGSSTSIQSQRRGIQRQPIIWDAATRRSQGTPSSPPPAVRGMHGARAQRGMPRARRATRGMHGSIRKPPRGGGS